MLVVSLNQDRGIGPTRKKGAAVHLEAMRAAFRALGHEVVEVDEPEEEAAQRVVADLLSRQTGEVVLYERYALGRGLGARLARDHAVPHVIELNAPLAEEERRYRGRSVDDEIDALERRIFSDASLTLAVSQQVALYAADRGASAERLLVRPNGVDATRFTPRSPGDSLRAELAPEGAFTLGFHGRLRPWHGIELLGRAAARLLERGVLVQLVLVGEGDFQAALEGFVPEQRVTRVAWVPHAEIPRYVAAFDALPLTYAAEGPSYFSPLKLAEAMAAGAVPVLPRLGDLPDLARDGDDALFYPAGDADALADAIERLARSPELHGQLSAAAVHRAQELSWTGIAEDVVLHLRSSGSVVPTRLRPRRPEVSS